jgi:Fe-S cluster biogenesis protein NfuA
MFIQTEETQNASELRFIPGVPVLKSGTESFERGNNVARSPLVERLFEIEELQRAELSTDTITLSKTDGQEWQTLKPTILGVMMDYFMSKQPVVLEDESATVVVPEELTDGNSDEFIGQIEELLETRIRPVAQDQGGDIIFHGFEDGRVILEFQGGAQALKGGVQTMLRHYIPEVEDVVDHLDMIPKPGLDTPEGQAIKRILDEDINPQIAMHGGHISLVDVVDDKAYVRLEGGCQGCGMASITLKQGVEGAIKQAAPSITQVLDSTDHAGGTNPYYQPGKDGMSP